VGADSYIGISILPILTRIRPQFLRQLPGTRSNKRCFFFYLVSAQAINHIAQVTVEQYDIEAGVLVCFLS
jgi:hypothetical protein